MDKDSNDGSSASRMSDSQIIDKFGGIRPMAAKLGIAVTTVQGWKARGHIPENRRQEIVKAAMSLGVDLGDGKAPKSDTPVPAAPPAAAEAPSVGVDAAKRPKEEEPQKRDRPEHKKPEPVKATPPAPTKPKPADGNTGRIAWIALVISVLLAVAVFTRPYWEPAAHGLWAGGPTATNLSGIEDTLDALAGESQARYETLTGRLAALEAGGGEAGAALATQLATMEKNLADIERALGSLDSGMQSVEGRLAPLEAARGKVPESVTAALQQSAADIKAMRAALDAMRAAAAARDERLKALETRPVQTGERIAALALAVGQVEAALSTGRPYRAALDRLVGIAPDDQAILDSASALYLRSGDGIPGRPALQRRFAELSPEIDRALADTGGDDWVDRAWHSLSTLVTVRRTDGVEASPVSRAEAAMADGDLPGVVKAFDSAGSLGLAGNAWLEDVRARVAAENEVEALYGRVIAPLAATQEAAK